MQNAADAQLSPSMVAEYRLASPIFEQKPWPARLAGLAIGSPAKAYTEVTECTGTLVTQPGGAVTTQTTATTRVDDSLNLVSATQGPIDTIVNFPGDVPKPCAMRGKNSLGDFRKGVITWQGIYVFPQTAFERLAGHRSRDKDLVEMIT